MMRLKPRCFLIAATLLIAFASPLWAQDPGETMPTVMASDVPLDY